MFCSTFLQRTLKKVSHTDCIQGVVFLASGGVLAKFSFRSHTVFVFSTGPRA